MRSDIEIPKFGGKVVGVVGLVGAQRQTLRSRRAPHDHVESRRTLRRSGGCQSLPLPRDMSAKVRSCRSKKSDLNSIVYEIRTKFLECGALETNGLREKILGLDRCAAVRRF